LKGVVHVIRGSSRAIISPQGTYILIGLIKCNLIRRVHTIRFEWRPLDTAWIGECRFPLSYAQARCKVRADEKCLKHGAWYASASRKFRRTAEDRKQAPINSDFAVPSSANGNEIYVACDGYTCDGGRCCHSSAAKLISMTSVTCSLSPPAEATASTWYGSAKEIYKLVNHDQAREIC